MSNHLLSTIGVIIPPSYHKKLECSLLFFFGTCVNTYIFILFKTMYKQELHCNVILQLPFLLSGES